MIETQAHNEEVLNKIIDEKQAEIEDLKLKIQTQKELLKMKTREIKKKDKIIAEIIEEYEYNARINFKNFCEDELRKDKCIQDCRNCAIEYFENKAEEDK